ncbi:MAG: hypothetical protein DI596_07140 [Azospira oryzae]|nr:MAG: hypothetical protein DI596_07140 [Azospira oryzae]PZP80101.1 MAG: hypothetical protein DI593_07140 [Azospira oryzae]
MKAIITIGLPACGKSTFASKLEASGWRVVERDRIREEICRSEGKEFKWSTWDSSREPEVQKLWAGKLEEAMASEERIVVSDTNLNHKYRELIANTLRGRGYRVAFVFFDVKPEVCVARNARRANPVEDDAWGKMIPLWEESRRWFFEKEQNKEFFLRSADSAAS